MKIAIIGWGSLIWDPRDLPREGVWQDGGPECPIEFSRISRDARLTLVIDPKNGKACITLHVLSPRSSLDDARDDLCRREGTNDKNIGWVDLKRETDSRKSHPYEANIYDTVIKWCKENGYDAAIWTALASNFKENTGKDFSSDAALKYLVNLPKNVLRGALKYIRNAPECIDTPVRKKTNEHFGEQ